MGSSCVTLHETPVSSWLWHHRQPEHFWSPCPTFYDHTVLIFWWLFPSGWCAMSHLKSCQTGFFKMTWVFGMSWEMRHLRQLCSVINKDSDHWGLKSDSSWWATRTCTDKRITKCWSYTKYWLTEQQLNTVGWAIICALADLTAKAQYTS